MMPHERRLNIRKMPDYLAYISLPSDNGGIVIDVSEGGLGFHAIAPVEADGPIHFRFAMDSSERVKAVGELAWKDETGKTCGLRFTELPDEVREQIRVWIGRSNLEAKLAVNSRAKASVLDIPAARPVIEVEAASSNNAELAHVTAAGNSLLHNLRPAVYSAPSNKLAMFPVELDFRAGATAAVVPQFVQMLDGMAEQVRIWVAESKTYGHNNSFADPAFGTDIAPRSETEWAPPVDIPLVEQPIEAEAVPSRNSELATVVDIPFAEPAIEPEVAPGSKTELEPLAAARNPHLYNSKHPIYGVSLFTLEPDSEAETTIITAPQPVTIKHPIAAVGLTIALAFLVSTGIFSYVCASRAGDLLFDWGQKMWGGVSSQPIPQDPAPQAKSAPDSSKLPQQ